MVFSLRLESFSSIGMSGRPCTLRDTPLCVALACKSMGLVKSKFQTKLQDMLPDVSLLWWPALYSFCHIEKKGRISTESRLGRLLIQSEKSSVQGANRKDNHCLWWSWHTACQREIKRKGRTRRAQWNTQFRAAPEGELPPHQDWWVTTILMQNLCEAQGILSKCSQGWQG